MHIWMVVGRSYSYHPEDQSSIMNKISVNVSGGSKWRDKWAWEREDTYGDDKTFSNL